MYEFKRTSNERESENRIFLLGSRLYLFIVMYIMLIQFLKTTELKVFKVFGKSDLLTMFQNNGSEQKMLKKDWILNLSQSDSQKSGYRS